MIKLKIFQEDSMSFCKRMIDEWMEENPNIDIIKIKTLIDNHSSKPDFMIFITYKEIATL